MKIDDTSKQPAGVSVNMTQTRAGKGTEKAGASSSKAPSANVTLSTQVQAMNNRVSNASVFDAKKVEEIKAAIASGQFQVNAERVADGLMDTVKNLISTQRG